MFFSPGTYGFEEQGDLVRIVWHHSSSNEQRTFQISYHMTGLAVAYDDVVDVNLQVWGDQWAVGLEHLEASASCARRRAGDFLFGHPWCGRGDVVGTRRGLPPWWRTMSPPISGWSCEPSSRGLFSHPPTEPGRPGTGWKRSSQRKRRIAEEASDATTAARTGLVWGGNRRGPVPGRRQPGLLPIRQGTEGGLRPGVRAGAADRPEARRGRSLHAGRGQEKGSPPRCSI